MSEPFSTGTAALIVKGYVVPSLAIFMGAVAHSLQEVKDKGWRGWLAFVTDIFVAMVAGSIFYQFIILFNPDYGILAAALGGYLGPNSVKFGVKSIKANLPK